MCSKNQDKKLKNSKVINIIVCFIVFFSFSNCVLAKNYNYKEIGSATNLYSNCNDGNNCIPICVYTCDNSDDCTVANNWTNGEIAYIGHYRIVSGTYPVDKDSGLDNIWEIGAMPTVMGLFSPLNYANLYIWTYDNLLSSKNFKYGDVTRDKKLNELGEWANTELYNNVSNSFVCPNYLHLGNKGMLSDAYEDANIFSKALALKVVFSNDEFIGAKKLSYSFINELNLVLNNAYKISSSNEGTSEFQLMHNAFTFLEEAGGYDQYDNSLSSNENIEKFCNFLPDDEEGYINGLDSVKFINSRLKQSADIYATRYKNLYNFEDLSSILTTPNGDKIKNLSGEAYIDRISNLYLEETRNALAYFNGKCDLNLDLNQIQQGLKEKIDEDYSNFIINPIEWGDKEFNCDTLFGGGVAELIGKAYFLLEILSIIILIVFSVLDYSKVILNGEADEIKKSNQKLFKRLIIVVVIFLLPALINTILNIFDIEGFNSDHPLCIEIKNK